MALGDILGTIEIAFDIFLNDASNTITNAKFSKRVC